MTDRPTFGTEAFYKAAIAELRGKPLGQPLTDASVISVEDVAWLREQVNKRWLLGAVNTEPSQGGLERANNIISRLAVTARVAE